MLYVILVFSIIIFINLFFLSFNISLIVLPCLVLANVIISKSIVKTLKRAVYIMPYFLAVLILQGMTLRGEYYNIFGILLDKTGVDFSVYYFLKILNILYFLSFSFFIIKKLKLPRNSVFDEFLRIVIFMKIVRKAFQNEFRKIKSKEADLKEKFNLISKLIYNIYNTSFIYYPYDEYILKYRYLESIIKTNSRFFTSL